MQEKNIIQLFKLVEVRVCFAPNSLISQAFDRIKSGSSGRRIDAEDQRHPNRKTKSYYDPEDGNIGRKDGGRSDNLSGRQPQYDAEYAPQTRKRHRLY